MITGDDLLQVGWSDMSKLNPDITYPYPTFGCNVFPLPRSGYSADYFVRVKESSIEVWSLAWFCIMFSGVIENKEEFIHRMNQLNINLIV